MRRSWARLLPLTLPGYRAKASWSPSRMKQTGVTWGRPSARARAMWASLVPAVTKDRHSSSVISVIDVFPSFDLAIPTGCDARSGRRTSEAPAGGAEAFLLTEGEHLRRLDRVDVPRIAEGG